MTAPRISMTWQQYLRRECGVDGVPVRLGRTKTEILSHLLLNRHRPVGIPELIEAVYPDPDREPEWPWNVVHSHICQLRRIIGRDAIVTAGWRGYTLASPAHAAQPDRLAA